MNVIKLSMTRLYLLEGGDGQITLIDTGYRKEYELFRRKLAHSGLHIEDINYLFLTHHHDDHAGFAARLMEDNPKIIIIARTEAEALLAAGHNNTSNGGFLLNRRIKALFNLKRHVSPEWDLSFPPVIMRPQDIRLSAERSDLSEKLGFAAQAVYTPGHTSDSQSLLLPDGTLFCGDMAARFLNFAGARYCTLFNENIEQVYQSWQTVLKLGTRRVYPAHGKSFSSETLRKHIDSHNKSSVVPYPTE
jgi:glyoxylase-like metal-dependent hydrolase (beta-lactamase superfamily II)